MEIDSKVYPCDPVPPKKGIIHRELNKYKSLKKRVENKIKYILDYPYNSELLTKKEIDLRGKRSKELTKNFRILLIDLDDLTIICIRISASLRPKNGLNCFILAKNLKNF